MNSYSSSSFHNFNTTLPISFIIHKKRTLYTKKQGNGDFYEENY